MNDSPADGEKGREAPGEAASGSRKGRRQPVDVLLVEDNPNDVELTIRVLKEHRLANHIQVARDGAEALELLLGDEEGGEDPAVSGDPARPHPRVVLLDLKLPKLSGLEVLKRIRENPRTRRVPVVVLTSSREDPDVEAAYDLGANSYVVKPVNFDDFTRAVKDLSLYWLLLNQPPEAGP